MFSQLNIFSGNTSDIVNYAPKLLICDLSSGEIVRTFVFPSSVAPYNSSFLNDIVLDVVNRVAYISDTGAVGGIVVYDFDTNSARRWGGDVTQQYDPKYVISINGIPYPQITTNEDGIALSPDLQVRSFVLMVCCDGMGVAVVICYDGLLTVTDVVLQSTGREPPV